MNENQAKIKQKIHNLENIISQNIISLEDKQILLKEIKRLKQELTKLEQNHLKNLNSSKLVV